jgi:hypothetical protein
MRCCPVDALWNQFPGTVLLIRNIGSDRANPACGAGLALSAPRPRVATLVAVGAADATWATASQGRNGLLGSRQTPSFAPTAIHAR